MKKKIILISFVIVIFITLCAVGSFFYYQKNVKRVEVKVDPLLYKACDEDSCIYLLGTIHLGDNRLSGLTDKIWNAYNDSDAIAFEVDILTATADDANAYLPEGDDLSNYLTEEQFNKLEEFLSKRLIPIDMIRNFNLATLSNFLELFVYQDLGWLSNNGVDYQLLEKSHEDNKEIIELESVEFQENLLYSFSDEFYINSIENTLDNYDLSKKYTEFLYNAYLYGNAWIIRELLREEEGTDEITQEYNEKMLYERNINMAEKAESYLKENKKVMIAVGSAHVIGERGLIELLRESGYEVSFVK